VPDRFLVQVREREILNVPRNGSMIDKDRLRYRVLKYHESNEATDNPKKRDVASLVRIITIETMIMLHVSTEQMVGASN
jgi:hypothetical protein